MSRTRNHPVLLGYCLVAFLLSLATSPLLAQGATATISGTVTDTTGAVLPGVEITIANVDTAQVRGAVSGDEGRYSAPLLGVGNYEVRAELSGFRTAVRRGLPLAVGQEAVVDFTMEIGQITEEVVVTGQAPLVNTTSSTLSEVISEIQVHDLPLNSRNLTRLSLLTPGVARIYTSISGGVIRGASNVRVSVAGARTYMTGYLLDGTDITDSSRGLSPGGASGSLFGVETVKEFQVITNNFSAQYGRFAGGVMSMVTKSGTNSFHGSVFEFHRNDNLDARNFFDVDPANPGVRSDPPEFIRNQFGATIGGPIVQDKTFFFFSYEGFRERLGRSLFDVVPTDEARLGIFPNGKIVTVNPDAKPFVDLYPSPNGQTLSDGITGEYFVNKSQPTNEDVWNSRVDHTFSESDSFFGRYTVSDGDRKERTALPFKGTTQDNGNHYVTLEEKHIFSPTTINTVRFGFQRNSWIEGQPPEDQGPLDFSLIPGVAMGRVNPEGGIGSLGLWVEGANVTNAFMYSDDLFMTRGRHDLKVGTQISRHQNNDSQFSFVGGAYTFGGLERMLLGNPRQWTGHIPGSFPQRGMRQTVLGFYIQDDFKWNPNFTVNLGLRYESITTPVEVNGHMANLRNPLVDTETTIGEPFFKNPSKKNFAPRIGFAWDPFGDGTTSVRAGFGLFHDTILMYHYANQIIRQPPFLKQVTVNDPPFPNPSAVGGSESTTVLPQEFEPHQPYMMNWNFTLQRELFTDITLTASYVGSKGTNLSAERELNTAVPEILPDGRKLFRSGSPRRTSAFGTIRYWSFSEDSNYHGFQLSMRKRFARGLQFQASYTHGRSIDTASRVNFSDLQDNVSKFPQDPYDVKGSNRGLSTHDVRHNFSFNYVYELPTQGLSGAAGVLLEGWQLNGVLSLSTGHPLQILLGGTLRDWTRDRNVFSLAKRPNVVPGGSNSPVRADGREPQQYFDPTAFEVQDPGYYGNVGRNTLIGPGVSTFDFSLFKNTDLAENVNLQFRAEFFNMFNRANFGTPNISVFGSATFEPTPCPVGDPAGCDRVTGSTFLPTSGRITRSRTTSRQIQLGLRLIF